MTTTTLDANFHGSPPPENVSNTSLTFPDIFSGYSFNNTSTTYGTSDSASPLFATGDTGRNNNNLFPSAESLLAQLNVGQAAPAVVGDHGTHTPTVVGDTRQPSGDATPGRSESPITDQAMRDLAQRFGISPEVLQSVKQLAEQFGLGQHFTAENVQKFLQVAQQHNLTQYMTPENLQMASQYIQQQGGLGQIISQARQNPEAAMSMITSMLPEQFRGQATAFVQDLFGRFRSRSQ